MSSNHSAHFFCFQTTFHLDQIFDYDRGWGSMKSTQETEKYSGSSIYGRNLGHFQVTKKTHSSQVHARGQKMSPCNTRHPRFTWRKLISFIVLYPSPRSVFHTNTVFTGYDRTWLCRHHRMEPHHKAGTPCPHPPTSNVNNRAAVY